MHANNLTFNNLYYSLIAITKIKLIAKMNDRCRIIPFLPPGVPIPHGSRSAGEILFSQTRTLFPINIPRCGGGELNE